MEDLQLEILHKWNCGVQNYSRIRVRFCFFRLYRDCALEGFWAHSSRKLLNDAVHVTTNENRRKRWRHLLRSVALVGSCNGRSVYVVARKSIQVTEDKLWI